ncbi:MAG: DedA family protein [Burkholderiales bacterium]|nr:DedA family protein [Burkholderiales bacterium]
MSVNILDMVLHLDKYLLVLTQNYGIWIYLILFLIIFCETGLVVAPFLPGDSMLFVAGTMAATGSMNVELLGAVLVLAAFCGDNTNYWIGRYLGPKVFSHEKSRFFNHEHLERTHAFYERHGGKTVIFSRFLPVIRTFAPFVAGLGSMSYRKFLLFSLTGGISWIGSFVYLGYYFGNLPFIRDNLSIFMVGIIVMTLLPGGIGILRQKFRPSRQSS